MIPFKDILDYIIDGQLWLAFMLISSFILFYYFIKEYKENPRLKLLPLTFLGLLFFILILEHFNLLILSQAWLSFAIVSVIYIYIYLVNSKFNFSHEKKLIQLQKSKLNTHDIDDYEVFFIRNKKLFISHLGKYHFYSMLLDFFARINLYSLCFKIMDEFQELKLTKEEKRKFLIQQFDIYCFTQATRIWENKYDSIKNLLKQDDIYYIDSILAYFKLDLSLSEALSQKLLASTSDSLYLQVAQNNIGLVAENNLQKIEWNDYSQKSLLTSQTLKINLEFSTLNRIHYFLNNDKPGKAEEVFQNFIKGLPTQTFNDLVYITNIKLRYFRQANDGLRLEEEINSLYKLYLKSTQSKKYPALISLLRISYNHQVRFKEVINEIEKYIDIILNSDFALIQWLTTEILGIARSLNQPQFESQIYFLSNKCLERLKTIDMDDEISKLRVEDVITKRTYIKFKSEISMLYIPSQDTIQFEYQLFRKFKIIDELINFDQKQNLAINVLDSTFLKLDEVTSAISTFVKSFKVPPNSEVINKLYLEGNNLISQILPIMQKAENSSLLAEYHLRLAHYNCCLNNKSEGFKHFQKYNKSKVNLLNFAVWLREWHYRLDQYFTNYTENTV